MKNTRWEAAQALLIALFGFASSIQALEAARLGEISTLAFIGIVLPPLLLILIFFKIMIARSK